MHQQRQTKDETITRIDLVRLPGEPVEPLTKLAGAVVEVDNADECIVSVPQLPDGAALNRTTVRGFKNGDPEQTTSEHLFMVKGEWVSVESYAETLDAQSFECFVSDWTKFMIGHGE
jgi:hypothetical protein